MTTPKYRVETRETGNPDPRITESNTYPWKGRATVTRLEDWRQRMNKSFAPGGINFHVSKSRGVVIHIKGAKIIRQSDGEVIAETQAPLFEVV